LGLLVRKMLRFTWKVFNKSRFRVSAFPRFRARDRGAALITVLLFVVLMFILITAMLTVTGNEIVIAGLQKDGMRATELAQAGIQEAIARVAIGRPYSGAGGWPSSLDPRWSTTPNPPCPSTATSVCVTVTRVYTGANSAYLQIDSTASNIGRATRRLTALVLQEVVAFPPNVTFANNVTEQGSAAIPCGDAYSQTYFQYKDYPSNSCGGPASLTYTGYRLSKVNPGAVAACYTHTGAAPNGCVAANPGNNDVAKWYPGTRVTTPATSTLGQDILGFQTNADPSHPTCKPTGGTYQTQLPSGAILQDETSGSSLWQYGYDQDDPDGAGPLASQLDPDLFPCGLPYEWVPMDFPDLTDENQNILPGGDVAGRRWFKTIVFEQWFQNYWWFDQSQMMMVKRAGGACVDPICVNVNTADASPSVQPNLALYPQFGAVPPFPDMRSITNNYECSKTGSGVLNSLPTPCTKPDGSATTSDLGCKYPEMACGADRSVIFELNGDWTINGNISGHGTLVVSGSLVVNGTFTYYGTIIVNCSDPPTPNCGLVQAGTGNVNVYGGLIAQTTLRLIGNISVNGGTTVSNVPTGNSLVFGKAWWER